MWFSYNTTGNEMVCSWVQLPGNTHTHTQINCSLLQSQFERKRLARYQISGSLHVKRKQSLKEHRDRFSCVTNASIISPRVNVYESPASFSNQPRTCAPVLRTASGCVPGPCRGCPDASTAGPAVKSLICNVQHYHLLWLREITDKPVSKHFGPLSVVLIIIYNSIPHQYGL